MFPAGFSVCKVGTPLDRNPIHVDVNALCSVINIYPFPQSFSKTLDLPLHKF